MKPALCPECRYDLRGLDESTQHCPECGSIIDVPAESIEARPRRTVRFPAITALGTVIAIIGGFVTLARFDTMLVDAPWQLLLTVVSIGCIVFAAGEPFRELRRLQPRADWPCAISMEDTGLHIVGSDLHGNAIDCLISWLSLKYVTVSCAYQESPAFLIRRRSMFEPEPQVPSFRLTPQLPMVPTAYHVNCGYNDAARMAKRINWCIRASRKAGRRSLRAAH